MKIPVRFKHNGDLQTNGELVEFPSALLGARNYQKDMSTAYQLGNTLVNVIDSTTLDVTFKNSVSSPYVFLRAPAPFVIGEEYTLNFYATFTTAETDINTIALRYGLRNGGFTDQSHNLTRGERVRIAYTFKPTASTGQKLILFNYNQTNVPQVRIEKVTITKGNKIADWAPAPEDFGLTFPEWVQSFGGPGFAVNGTTATEITEGAALAEKTLVSLKDGGLQVAGEWSEYPDIVQDGLLLWYDFMGRSNADHDKNAAIDLSGHGNNGSLLNFDYTTGSGYEGDGLRLDGVDDRILIENSPELNVADGLTLEWNLRHFETTKLGGFVKGNSGGWALNSYGIRQANAKFIFYIADGVKLNQLTVPELSTEDWHHLVGVTSKEKGTLDFYVNGKLVASMTRTVENINPAPQNIEIGTAYTGVYSNASIRSARIYNRALTPEEIVHNYEAEKGRWGN